jgi:hypothetical protein
VGWFPPRFKVAKTVVLQKPGKPPAAYQTPAGYRPIALLPTISKVIEAVVAKRVAEAAEANGLLPEEQMGNRAHRSTELAIRLVVAQVQEAWRQRAAASLLQLDISGAFDTVNHPRLLATLRDFGFPRWLVLWTKAWLADRSAILCFDGKATEPIPVTAGVPQGSPLSPVLFLLYISTLYRVLKERHPHLGLVGFADDTNLLAFGRTPEANVRQLEKAWDTCLQWAKTRGMAFAAEKSELVHFNKGRRQWAVPVHLALPQGGGTRPIQPTQSARFLGAWLDWRLQWGAHRMAIEGKLRTQEYALTRITAKTWGPSLAQAREIYTKCIRSAIAYGASSAHTPTPPQGQPQGIAKGLAKAQNRSLRVVTGAYRATPTYTLETEAWVPPLDLYLNKRRADFERRIRRPVLPGGQRPIDIINRACLKLYKRFRKPRGQRGPQRVQGPQEPTTVEKQALAALQWAGRRPTRQALREAWEERWMQKVQVQGREPGRPADWDPPNFLFTNRALARHQGLTKAQSSLLTQARVGAIGLRGFLFRARVPDVNTPLCACGEGVETVEHLVVWCRHPPRPKPWAPWAIRTRLDLYYVLRGGGARARRLARGVVNWLLQSGRLPEYRLAARLDLAQEPSPG